MEKIIELFECQIGDTTNAYPSIFSKDDVVTLLINLKDNVLKEVSELKPATSKYDVDAINRGVADILDGFDFEEFFHSEPELQGGYGSSFSLEMNISFDEYQFARQLEADLTDYFKDLNKEDVNN
jgi:hypothetical protein